MSAVVETADERAALNWTPDLSKMELESQAPQPQGTLVDAK